MTTTQPDSVDKGAIRLLRSYKGVWFVALLIAFLQTLYAIGFIARTSFVVEGQRYFCLFDDAMISMRYADNWAAGRGFVWNVDERVEGYTTFAWTGIMGLCHLLRLSPSNTCLLVQILGIPILWACLAGTVFLARSCRLLPASAYCAVVVAGAFYNLMFFTLFGMETGLLTCLVTFALADAAQSVRKKEGRFTTMLWFAPAVLVRMDIVPVMLFIFAFLCFSVKKGRVRLILGLLAVVFILFTHFLWRHHFYGEWLPNTYYLKATGWPLANRLVAGIRQSLWTAGTFGFPVLLALMALLRPKRRHLLVLGSFAICVAYQVYVGGDAWPLNRFVIPASIGLFVLTAEGMHRLIMLFIKRKFFSSTVVARVVLTLLCVVAVNTPHWDHLFLLTPPQTTGDRRMNIRCMLAIEKIADHDASVAVGYAGVLPYFSKRRCIDLLGKCDAHIAHLPADVEIPRAGHNKHDLEYSLTTYKPDIILHVVDTRVPECYQNYLPVVVEVDGTDVAFCVRKDSDKVRGGRIVGWLTFDRHFLKMIDEKGQDF